MSAFFTVDASLPARVVLNAKGLTRLAQQIRTLMTTPRGSLPLDRDFGIDPEIIDAPVNTAVPLYVADISRQIEKYIPQVRVRGVTFSQGAKETAEGIMKPVGHVAVRKEYAHEFV